MKLSFCVEHDTDELVVRTLVGAIRKQKVVACGDTGLRVRNGWQRALELAPKIARDAHLKGCDGAVFVVDNDGAPAHEAGHLPSIESRCRLCQLLHAAAVDQPARWPRPGLAPMVFAFGIAVQAIETWLLHARRHDFKGQDANLGCDASGRRALKKLLYGVENPNSQHMMNTARETLGGLDVASLAGRSPSFADFRRQVEAWPPAPGP